MTDIALSTKEIGIQAWKLAYEFGTIVGVEELNLLTPEFESHLEGIVHKIIMEASNPNPLFIMAKEHDEGVAAKIKDGWRLGPYNPDEKSHPELLPFSQLPIGNILKAQYFRNTVLTFKQVWSGH